VSVVARPMQVWFDETHEAGELVRRLVFEDIDGPQGPAAASWWRVPAASDLPAPPVLDSLVCAHLLWAARRGQDLVVHGPMSRGGLYNMGQLAALRHALSPERYPRVVAVEPARVVDVARPEDEPERAVAGLSGGLDSTFTAVRHARGLVGDARWTLDALVIVLGFDLPLHRPDRFEELRRRLAPLADALGLPLHVAATNSAALGGQAWPQSAMPLIGAVLSLFGARCGVGIVSAGAPHGIPRFGISHPPLLDALASNDWFRLVTDGGGHGRTDKIEALRDEPHALAAMKVCWQGPDPARNCGRCEKCVMTRLNFLAAGIPDPPCFDEPLALAHVAALELPSLQKVRDLYRTCWNELEARRRGGPIVELLRWRLARVPPEETLARVRRVAQVARRVVPAPVRRRLRAHLPAALRP